jgi:hypothetical protein
LSPGFNFSCARKGKTMSFTKMGESFKEFYRNFHS